MAFDALSRWLAWRRGDAGAAAGIGSGGVVSSSELEKQLRVGCTLLHTVYWREAARGFCLLFDAVSM